MRLNVQNETAQLQTVVLGRAESNGANPTLDQTFDAKSYETVKNNDYPKEEDLIAEMSEFEQVLKKYNVEVLRPTLIEDCNQVFSRDVGFVIEDEFFIANIIPDRLEELQAYREIKRQFKGNKINALPEEVYVEGGDVILYNDYIFVGTYKQADFKNYKTGRTNVEFVEYIKAKFPNKNVLDFELKKNDEDPYEGILHLDCTFNPVGKDKAIIYKDGFLFEHEYQQIVDIFGKENLFEVTKEEMYWMNPNVFSISPEVVVSEKNFTRLNDHLENVWNIKVERINYREVSKMGGLLRCSTMPLIRK
ncbi:MULTISPECIES: dimethylarginine dimethylaminohydrolase family protein [Empedobacter]|uniref:arginine deiminase n=1 Tax=Empedobacter falsenii TaxID=343874 RepID=A0A376G8G6_9FLAO|nr:MULTISPECIES: amidinotransferase [Empedobacter]MDH0659138.1 amidinotransferase [Empedobacter sp. GD03865]MDH1881401.1 amidinotransferase [Empedobacter sp. GD03797]MDH2206633.1 amidinotransferase [Empedobacter sp. GD03644]MDM1040320.1 amidinotransferase [Empedobacter brevis]MDM1134252.1 amidinotransferase [Empedobacter sp. R750]